MSKESTPMGTGEQLFDQLPENSILGEEEAKLNYDGTTLDGRNVVRVNFDGRGDVIGINSYNTNDLKENGRFVRGKNGWEQGVNFYDDFTPTGIRLNQIVRATTEEWKIWKSNEQRHFGMDFQQWKTERRAVIEQLKKY